MYYNKNPKPHHKLDRQHYTYKGKPKVAYNSEEDACKALEKLPGNYVVYKCQICNKWHIGFKK